MANAEFNYDGNKINIKCKLDEEMNSIIKRFESTIGNPKEELYYIYDGRFIKKDLSFNNQANSLDRERKIISILVNKIIPDDSDECLKKSDYLICPKCKEKARISVKDYKINIYDCKNEHKIEDILINDFETTQNIDESKIKCQFCKKVNKSNTYNNTFFICMNCKKNICPICSQNHEKTHSIIDYDDKFFICDIHYEPINSYCEECKKDICMSCEKKHKGHKIITYGSIIPEAEIIKEEVDKFISKKESFKCEIKDIISKLNNLINTLDNYFKLYQDIILCYEKKKRNYFLLKNVHDMMKNNNFIIEDIIQIINEKCIKNKIDKIFDIYIKMNLSSEKENICISNAEENVLKDKKNDEEFNTKLNIENNKNRIIEINKELMNASEKNKDNDYKDFNLGKIKKILTLKTEFIIIIKKFVLKDGRVIVSGKNAFNEFITYIFDLKKENYFQLSMYSKDIVQMDDGMIILLDDQKIFLLEIKEKSFEIIKTIKLKVFSSRLIKLSNREILIYSDDIPGEIAKIIIYIYEDRRLILEKEKTLNSTKNCSICEQILAINSSEIVMEYLVEGFLGNSYYLGFFDIEKDKQIGYFRAYGVNAICLINKELFIFSLDNKFYPVHLKNHIKKNSIKLDNHSYIYSICKLNEKYFLVGQHDYISQFEIEKNYQIKFVNSIEIKNYHILPYLNNKLIFDEEGGWVNHNGRIHIYG